MKIKIYFLAVFAIVGYLSSCSVVKNTPSIPTPYFNALIVKDIDVSLKWYIENLGLKIIDNNAYPERGLKQANLKKGNTLIELIELNTAKSVEAVIPGYTNKTRLIGIFKMGYSIRHFDQWLSHLNKNRVELNGTVVTLESGKRMVIVKDPDGNRVQFFEK